MDGRKVYLPKIGWVAFWRHREVGGTVKNVTVSRQGHHWHVAFQTEMDVPEPVHTATAAVGIDLGIATFAAFSDGQLYPPLNAYCCIAHKKARMQRKLAGMVKYSHTGSSSSDAWHSSTSALPIAATTSCTAQYRDQQKPRGHLYRALAGQKHVALGTGHRGGTREQCCCEIRFEQGDSGSRLGHVSAHAGV